MTQSLFRGVTQANVQAEEELCFLVVPVSYIYVSICSSFWGFLLCRNLFLSMYLDLNQYKLKLLLVNHLYRDSIQKI